MIQTKVYINNSDKGDSLLGERDARRLGIITLNEEGAGQEVQVARVLQNRKQDLDKERPEDENQWKGSTGEWRRLQTSFPRCSQV